MAKQFDSLDDTQSAFIADQHLFFVATAAPDGHVNLSPKGMDSLRVLGPNRIVWLNYTGSGNETAGHLLQANRMTLMWCSFGKRPMILRVYGTAQTVHVDDTAWPELAQHFDVGPGARQIFEMSVDLVQTSCGYAVPMMEFQQNRDVLVTHHRNLGEAKIREYWRDKNTETLNGAPTGIPVLGE